MEAPAHGVGGVVEDVAGGDDDVDVVDGGEAAARAAFRVGAATLVGGVAVLLVAVLVRTGGTFVYVLDDPAIHLAVARRLAYDGTWGVVAGEFQSASSSALWTLVLAPTQLVVRGRAGELVPLALNVACGLAMLRLVAPELARAGLRPGRSRPSRRHPDRERPGRGRPGRGRLARWCSVDTLAVAVVTVGPLFLVGLAFIGMEHTLHAALVLAAALATERRWAPPPGPPSPWWPRLLDHPGAPFALVALATLARAESAALAVALTIALLTTPRRASSDDRTAGGTSSGGPTSDGPTSGGPSSGGGPPRGSRWWGGVGLGVASGGALAVVAAVHLAFGQGPLPNSVILKAVGDRGDTGRSVGAALDRLATDPWLAATAVISLAVVVAWATAARHPARREALAPALFPAVTALVVALLHAELGAVDPSLRYAAYAGALGTWVALRAAPALARALPSRRPHAGPPAALRGPTGPTGPVGLTGRRPRRAVAVAVVVALLAVPAARQLWATARVPQDAHTFWHQRYQVARFLGDTYAGAPIAIGELGYIALYHDGPLTDVYGLADREVLEAALDEGRDPAFWSRLQAERGFVVVVTYDFSVAQVPEGWIRVADWVSPDAHFPVTRFWAAVPEEVAPLLAHLRAAEPGLPDGVEVTYDEWAEFRANAALQGS